jgi:hypothetical protein
LNSELEPPAFAGAIPFTDRDAMVVGQRRSSISSYRATHRMSMRTIPASLAILCFLNTRASAAADSANALPAGGKVSFKVQR